MAKRGQHAKKTASPWMVVFVIAVFAVLITPFAAMSFAPTTSTSENTELAELPQLVDEDGFNVSFLNDLGDYFEDHFAFRNYLISANAHLKSSALKVSNTDRVIVGDDGWLYYFGTLDDYLGRDLLEDDELDAIAYNLLLTQNYVESHDSEFLFTVPPNKNSLYGDAMPWRYQASVEPHNAEALTDYLYEYGVNYTDLFDLFNAQPDEDLYYLRDTHWNLKGALLAYDALLDAASISHEIYDENDLVTRNDYIGDINEILYPVGAVPEQAYYFKDPLEVTQILSDGQVNTDVDAIDVEAPWIETSTENAEGTLLMYRDSFGNALLLPLAAAFSHSYFTKYVPYNMTQVESLSPTLTIIERTERRVADLGVTPPIIPAPEVDISDRDIRSYDPSDSSNPFVSAQATVEPLGGFQYIEGTYRMLPSLFENQSLMDIKAVYVSLDAQDGSSSGTYQAFRTFTDPRGENEDMAAPATTEEGQTGTSAPISGFEATLTPEWLTETDFANLVERGFSLYVPQMYLTGHEYAMTIFVETTSGLYEIYRENYYLE